MSPIRRTLVLFPGAWGNQTKELASWWMRHVISYFETKYEIVIVTYAGKSLDAYVDSALQQLQAAPDGSLAICYSMGAQIARGVAAKRPTLFKSVALLSGLERTGVRFEVFLRALTFMLLPMLRTLIGRPLMLDTIEQVKRVFLRPSSPRQSGRGYDHAQVESERKKLAQDLLQHRLVPEPAWAMLRLFLPGLRQRFPPFVCLVMAIVPREDFILPFVDYQDEDIELVSAAGDHALILDEVSAKSYLGRIAKWFHRQEPILP